MAEQERGLRAPRSSPLHRLSRNDISCHLCYASFYISLIIPPPGERSYVTGRHRELHLKPGSTAVQDGATRLAAPPAQRETKAQPEPSGCCAPRYPALNQLTPTEERKSQILQPAPSFLAECQEAHGELEGAESNFQVFHRDF